MSILLRTTLLLLTGLALALPVQALAGWVAKSQDNICGLSDARMISSPAKVQFDSLMKKTPEMKRLESQGIDPNSAEGIQLRQAARLKVTRACEQVRVQEGHCSVWRAIRHTGGKQATDITAKVRALL